MAAGLVAEAGKMNVVNNTFPVTPSSNLTIVIRVGQGGSSTNTSVGSIVAANGTSASGNTPGGPGSGSAGGTINSGAAGVAGSGSTGGKGGNV